MPLTSWKFIAFLFTLDLPLIEKVKEKRLERKRDLVGSREVEVGRKKVGSFQAQKKRVEN